VVTCKETAASSFYEELRLTQKKIPILRIGMSSRRVFSFLSSSSFFTERLAIELDRILVRTLLPKINPGDYKSHQFTGTTYPHDVNYSRAELQRNSCFLALFNFRRQFIRIRSRSEPRCNSCSRHLVRELGNEIKSSVTCGGLQPQPGKGSPSGPSGHGASSPGTP